VGSRRESRGLYHPSQRTHRRVIWQPGFALFPRARATHPGR
jgi:hypothetical protein